MNVTVYWNGDMMFALIIVQMVLPFVLWWNWIMCHQLPWLEEQKNHINGLDKIREVLPSSKSLQEKPPSEGEDKGDHDNSVQCNTNKSKKDLAGREVTQMNLVLQHPSFQSDPYSTIREHLLNTLAAQAEEQTVEDKKRRHEEKEKAAEKKTLKKERLREAKFSKPKNKRAGSTLNAVKKTRRGRWFFKCFPWRVINDCLSVNMPRHLKRTNFIDSFPPFIME